MCICMLYYIYIYTHQLVACICKHNMWLCVSSDMHCHICAMYRKCINNSPLRTSILVLRKKPTLRVLLGPCIPAYHTPCINKIT